MKTKDLLLQFQNNILLLGFYSTHCASNMYFWSFVFSAERFIDASRE
jgi:hypothetical protein